MTLDDNYLTHPSDFVKRLQAFATLTLGHRPSTGQVQQAITRAFMQDRGTDRESMLSLARELFPEHPQNNTNLSTEEKK